MLKTTLPRLTSLMISSAAVRDIVRGAGTLMIFYLSTKANRYTLKWYLDGWERELATRVRLLSYETIFKMKALPIGSYIFSDLERLSIADTERASRVWQMLSESGNNLRVLNHPALSMRLLSYCARGTNAASMTLMSID